MSDNRTKIHCLASEHAKEWKEAADSEYKSLMENETWELPKDREAIGCKWVFKVKHTSDGKVERFKGRLVAKGYAQKCGIDYDETFTCCTFFINTVSVSICCAKQNADSPDGCCNRIPKWRIG